MSEERTIRIQALADAVKEYASKEKKRIEDEVAVLKTVLAGRTGGAGVQAISVKRVTEVANYDLQAYLGTT